MGCTSTKNTIVTEPMAPFPEKNENNQIQQTKNKNDLKRHGRSSVNEKNKEQKQDQQYNLVLNERQKRSNSINKYPSTVVQNNKPKNKQKAIKIDPTTRSSRTGSIMQKTKVNEAQQHLSDENLQLDNIQIDNIIASKSKKITKKTQPVGEDATLTQLLRKYHYKP